MSSVNNSVSKHFSWVPVSFILFAYNRDIHEQVLKGNINKEGLLGVVRAFYISNRQAVVKFEKSANPIPTQEQLVDHIIRVANGEQVDVFYGDIYRIIKTANAHQMDVEKRRVMFTEQLMTTPVSGKVSDFKALGVFKDMNVIRAAVDIIDEMFVRDGTYPRKPRHVSKNKKPQKA